MMKLSKGGLTFDFLPHEPLQTFQFLTEKRYTLTIFLQGYVTGLLRKIQQIQMNQYIG